MDAAMRCADALSSGSVAMMLRKVKRFMIANLKIVTFFF
jgi:hypothetical protein